MEKAHANKSSGIRKVAIVGPESTGKSTLSEFLAGHFKTLWVKEFARTYLNEINRPYIKEDLGTIARRQIQLEDYYAKRVKKLLICDTNLVVIKIWSEHKYGYCESWILEEIKKRKYDMTLLTNVDLPWVDDPQREHPHMRKYFFDVYYNELKSRNLPFQVISGDVKTRMKQAVLAVNSLF